MTWLRRQFFRVFPQPRVPITFWSALPLVIFLAIYAVVVFTVQQFDQYTFTKPWRFCWIAVAIWVWWMSINGWSGLNRRRAAQSLFVRLCLLGVFVALIAEPRSVRTSDQVAVIYAIDMSESIHPDQVSEALKFVAKTVAEKPEGDEAGLIVFGSTAAVELPPDTSFPVDEKSPAGSIHLNSRIDRDATNLEQTLSLASAVLPEEMHGRVVLISDGSETTGDLTTSIQELQSRGIAVDVLPIQYSYDKEVWIERLELPQSVKIGEAYEASVVVSALGKGKGKLVIEENGKPIQLRGDGATAEENQTMEIEFTEGKNRIDVPIYLRTPGFYRYEAKLIVDDTVDSRKENNRSEGHIYVEGEGKALVVIDPLAEDARDYERLVRAINESERSVEVMESYDFPTDALSLLPYDCIIFANAPQEAFDPLQFEALQDAIYNQGTGFLMVGGDNSFGPGGYHRTVVEDVLPVSMDITKKKILPKGALAIILHTCEFPEGNTWAKRITKQAIKVLGEQDEVGVLAYGAGGDNWIFELTPAGDYEKMVPKINAASIGDMPAFGPTMTSALKALKANDAATKHMIVISDGDPQPPPPAILQQYVAENISISTVAVFPHGGVEIGLLKRIANTTKGNYYFPDDPNELPSIFIKEAKTLKRSMIQEIDFHPHVGYPSPVLEGIDGMPELHGFVLTSLKENALTEDVLFAETEQDGEKEQDPVLAIWRHGLGTTAAFTSSLSNQWADDWVTWEQYTAFVKQLLIRISRVRKAGQLRMWTYHSGGQGVIMVEDFHQEEMFLDVAAQIVGPDGSESTIPLKQIGPRRYQGTFPANDKGQFQVTAVGLAGEREDRVFGGFVVSYSPEYLKFTSDFTTLRDLKEKTNGTELSSESTAADVYNRRVPKQTSQPVFDWFLIVIAILLLIDVGIRRVQIDWSAVNAWFSSSQSEKSKKTMGALLAKKKEVGEQLKSRREEAPMQASSPAPYQVGAEQKTDAKKSSKSTSAKSQSKPIQDTTTSRLLDMKRKRQEEDED